MASPPLRRRLPPALLLPLLPLFAAADLVLEDGYTVTTAVDLNTHAPSSGVHPYALLPRPRAGDLVLLDSAGSAIYTLALPGGDLRRFAGGRRAGFDDGGPADAAFNRPRSIAVDGADNVYVADRIHGAVRKVAPSGFTSTIAGGLSSGNGHRDGPAQNATFSPDFELVYVPKTCALLVADRGNGLIRQINLKPEDCPHETQRGLGSTSVLIIAILCALFGSVIGFLARHFYPVHEISINRFFSRIQKKYKRTQRKAALISFCDIRSVVANSMFYTFLLKIIRVSCGYLTVVFPSVTLESGVAPKPFRLVELYKSAIPSARLKRSVPRKPSHLVELYKTDTTPNTGLHKEALDPSDQLGDLISFAGDTDKKEDNGMAFGGSATSQEDKEPSFGSDVMGLIYTPQGSHKKIDHMIEANLSGFSSKEESPSLTVNSYGVSRRRLHGDSMVL